jgi:hypothetical protein
MVATKGIIAPKKMGTNTTIGKSESLEGVVELDPSNKPPAKKRIKKTTIPTNSKNMVIKTRMDLSNLF